MNIFTVYLSSDTSATKLQERSVPVRNPQDFALTVFTGCEVPVLLWADRSTEHAQRAHCSTIWYT